MQKTAEIKRDWILVDIAGKILGDVAGEIAKYLIGKHKPTYTPHMDGGDFVVAINATQVVVTGKKHTDKIYYNHSGFPGGMRERSFNEVMEKNPAEIIERAVKGMLPSNKLQTPRLRRLKVFATSEHTYTDKFSK